MLISSSYQASEAGFVAAGLEPDAAVEALRSTTALAVEARARFALDDPTGARDVLVAASVGPYGATLGDGSEYRAPTLDDLSLVDFHTARLRVLIDTEPNLLAIETISSTRETYAIVSALDVLPPIRAWVTFTCRDTASTWGGDPIEEAVAAAVTCPSVMAVGVNCTAPDHVSHLLERIGQITDLPLVAYPNGGQSWDAAGKVWNGTASGLAAEDLAEWVGLGARYLGGCCGVGPAGIALLADALGRKDEIPAAD